MATMQQHICWSLVGWVILTTENKQQKSYDDNIELFQTRQELCTGSLRFLVSSTHLYQKKYLEITGLLFKITGNCGWQGKIFNRAICSPKRISQRRGVNITTFLCENYVRKSLHWICSQFPPITFVHCFFTRITVFRARTCNCWLQHTFLSYVQVPCAQ